MASRKVYEQRVGDYQIQVRRNAEWEEWSVRTLIAGRWLKEVDSFHGDDKEDACNTAYLELARRIGYFI